MKTYYCSLDMKLPFKGWYMKNVIPMASSGHCWDFEEVTGPWGLSLNAYIDPLMY